MIAAVSTRNYSLHSSEKEVPTSITSFSDYFNVSSTTAKKIAGAAFLGLGLAAYAYTECNWDPLKKIDTLFEAHKNRFSNEQLSKQHNAMILDLPDTFTCIELNMNREEILSHQYLVDAKDISHHEKVNLTSFFESSFTTKFKGFSKKVVSEIFEQCDNAVKHLSLSELFKNKPVTRFTHTTSGLKVSTRFIKHILSGTFLTEFFGSWSTSYELDMETQPTSSRPYAPPRQFAHTRYMPMNPKTAPLV